MQKTGHPMKTAWILLATTCALVIGVYVCTAQPGSFTSSSLNAADEYYNLLVQGFRAGQLNLKTEVPPGFAQLADPYDPQRLRSFPVFDMSYYKGKLYLYFGVTPAVVLFWPYVSLTGNYLPQRDAVVVFCLVGFLTSVGLIYALWRRYFAEVHVAVVAAGAVALGLAPCTPFLLARCDVYEVPISCGYAFTMLALAGIWKALHETGRRGWCLAAASLAYGLAVGARPPLLFGAVILLVPVAYTWREGKRIVVPLLAAVSPIALIGLGLMLYNWLRFNSPFEFGFHYQLASIPQFTAQFFSLRYLWINFRLYFLEPVRWRDQFPFVRDIRAPHVPPGYRVVDHTFALLTNIPLVWMALAVPLAWRRQFVGAQSPLRAFLVATVLLCGICTVTMALYWCAAARYEVEFLPAWVLLAVVGILGLEHALAPTSESGLADRPMRRWAARWGWGLLLGFSVAFNLFVTIDRCGEAHNSFGVALAQAGQLENAIEQYERALHLKPDYAEAHYNWALALVQLGRLQESISHWEQALRLKPDYAEAHNNLGAVMDRLGRPEEAIRHYEEALRINPDYAEAHNNLAIALERAGRVPEAIEHFGRAVHLKPDYAEAHVNLGIALAKAGRMPGAIEHWEEALRLRPDDAVTHYNLGTALQGQGRVPEATEQYEQVLRLRPDLSAASNALARLRAAPIGR
jgi:Flp pilus assembly protein TadD